MPERLNAAQPDTAGTGTSPATSPSSPTSDPSGSRDTVVDTTDSGATTSESPADAGTGSNTGTASESNSVDTSSSSESNDTTSIGTDSQPDESPCEVHPLTPELRQSYGDLDPFYTKYADAAGLPVVSSDAPSDRALVRVCELVIDMTMRADVRTALIDNHVRFAVIGQDEKTNDIPEFDYLPDSINERARGLGGLPAASCAEESILCDRERDRWRGEGICVHEFAHTISMGGLFYADATFESRLQEAFENAQSTGLFANTYAMENVQEYWAEGVQSWYYTNLEAEPPNGIHNSINGRKELEQYAPMPYKLVAEFLPEPLGFVDCYSDE